MHKLVGEKRQGKTLQKSTNLDVLNPLGSKGGTEPAITHNWHSRGRGEEEEGRQKRGSSLLHFTPSSVNSRALPFSQGAFHSLSHRLFITSTQHPANRTADPRLQPQKETFHCLLPVQCAQLPWQCPSSLLLKNNHCIDMKDAN